MRSGCTNLTSPKDHRGCHESFRNLVFSGIRTLAEEHATHAWPRRFLLSSFRPIGRERAFLIDKEASRCDVGIVAVGLTSMHKGTMPYSLLEN